MSFAAELGDARPPVEAPVTARAIIAALRAKDRNHEA